MTWLQWLELLGVAAIGRILLFRQLSGSSRRRKGHVPFREERGPR